MTGGGREGKADAVSATSEGGGGGITGRGGPGREPKSKPKLELEPKPATGAELELELEPELEPGRVVFNAALELPMRSEVPLLTLPDKDVEVMEGKVYEIFSGIVLGI